MVDINIKQHFSNLLANSLGLIDYQKIQTSFVECDDLSSSEDFQKQFNSFYKIRRNQEWRDYYYTYFQTIRTESPSFEQIIKYLYKKEGHVEASFSSKMLATINPDKPIWDQYVLKNLNLKLEGSTPGERLENAIKVYSKIEEKYKELLQNEGKKWIVAFDQAMPQYKNIPDVKKIDCILWSKR